MEQPQAQGIYLEPNPRDWSWLYWPAVPLYPYSKRRTLCREIVRDTIWTFEQVQGFLYTVVPIRMTVVKLKAGGLFVYAPVAPTKECVHLVNELVVRYGDVKYIIFPTSSGLEHKVFVGPFARQFPKAQVFVAPHQWSFPLNLPLSWLGFPQRRTQVLSDISLAPSTDEFDYAILDINLGPGSFVEVAVLHKESRSLLVTDAVVSVPEKPPAIVQLDPYPLLFHARDSALQVIDDNEANRRKGWERISLFANYFRPSAMETIGLGSLFRNAKRSPDRSAKAYFGLFPFRWKDNWQESFNALRGYGRPFVAPILQTLIFPQAPTRVLRWVDKISSWDFERIIPCHFDAPIEANPSQFRHAFAFLDKKSSSYVNPFATRSYLLPEEDFKFIKELEASLIRFGIVTPPREN
ncbi:DUF4336 domain-containing protein [Aetokthonos hydrillicola Thurmond2011]|jgi:hypothetical protein|uniref:DUF4336 domain-containing protein n=1 Tax=Aetokthonos hydrillicola Thurmond2011 TaxID=2712845 RepID=A0AAP5ICA0_9CYAN|nr:DUF4336 domain-containing protein [Aetokthonos hydrillicola]MBW4586916.1 DUF4336 domain-containing protein [Aetokthonos hydrillicola CCALA 1050]MDR9897609.1 DUF4336 domain-containing protein [Aetokthonos hydrillicola Thurmond2011]